MTPENFSKQPFINHKLKMILIQLTGLSGAGKSTLSSNVKAELQQLGYKVEIIDGDIYRQNICRDLGFSEQDRIENIRRLSFIGLTLAKHGVVVILAAINPFEDVRQELKSSADFVKTVWVDCDLETLVRRDTKGLYKRALLLASDPDRLENLTGINDRFDIPQKPDLILKTNEEDEAESSRKLLNFILQSIDAGKEERPRALFIGRWQPFHNGHKWLIEQKLKQNIPVLIAVRDMKPDSANPLSTGQTIHILREMYAGEDVKIIAIPNIESVNFGRTVGYEINEFSPPESISVISATGIRNSIKEKSSLWKESVDEKIQDLVSEYLTSRI